MESYIVLLDFSEPFDRVSDSGLFFKFKSIGVGAVCWLFVQSSSPTIGREFFLMVMRVSGS